MLVLVVRILLDWMHDGEKDDTVVEDVPRRERRRAVRMVGIVVEESVRGLCD